MPVNNGFGRTFTQIRLRQNKTTSWRVRTRNVGDMEDLGLMTVDEARQLQSEILSSNEVFTQEGTNTPIPANYWREARIVSTFVITPAAGQGTSPR